MADATAALSAAGKAPAAVRALRAAYRSVYSVPMWLHGLALVLALTGAWLGWELADLRGAAPGALVALAVGSALSAWAWALRPARGRTVVYLSEFAEHSTDAAVRSTGVHRHELATKLEAEPMLEDALELRRLPPLSEHAGRRLLCRSPGSALVRGETTVAGHRVRWRASMLWRAKAHSRYASNDEAGEPGFRVGSSRWTPGQLLRLPTDADQPITLLTHDDFPASHAEGVLLMVLALASLAARDEGQLRQFLERLEASDAQAPGPVRVFTRIGRAHLALAGGGYTAQRDVLLRAVEQEGLCDGVLQSHLAGWVAIGCAHGLDTTERWLRVTEPLGELRPGDPRGPFLRACALMSAGRWAEAHREFGGLDPRGFQGPLFPDRMELLTAQLQAAELCEDTRSVERVLRRMRRVMRRRRPWRRMPSWGMVWLLAWAQPHNYDALAGPAMQERLDELGLDVDLASLRSDPEPSQDAQA